MPTLEPVPISMVVHYVYCPRRAWLEAQGEQVDSYQMQEGFSAHRRVDEGRHVQQNSVASIPIWSRRLGITGKTDIVRLDAGTVSIREYKATPVRKKAEVTDGMRLQLALQSLCLTEMGNCVRGTEIYFTKHNQTIPVKLTAADFCNAEDAVRRTRDLLLSTDAPEPRDDTEGCAYCSHVEVCLPDEKYLQPIKRRVLPHKSDMHVISLITPGTYAHITKGRLLVEVKGEKVGTIPVETIQALRVQGNVNLSGGLIKELLQRDIPIAWCTTSGRLLGYASSANSLNASTRQAQHALSMKGSLLFAREFIAAKIANQAIQLRRSEIEASTIHEMHVYQHQCEKMHDLQALLGMEGKAASIYFANWPSLIKVHLRDQWEWGGRSAHPASDAINAMLNYCYALLMADEIKAIIACGLDPYAGFLHSSNRNKPALALDLMEEMRAPIADSVVQTAINCQMVKPSEFTETLGSVRMAQSARKTLIQVYKRRMETEIVHPIFQYKVTWRRALEIQARQVLAVLEHSQERYKGMRVR